MANTDLTLSKVPDLKAPDNLLLEKAEQSSRPDILTFEFAGIARVLVTIPTGAEALLGRFDLHEMGPRCVNFAPFKGAECGVSRRHAKIKHDELGWWIEDTGSSNGTWVNGEKLLPHRPHLFRSNSHLLLAQLECYLILPNTKKTDRFKKL